MITHDAAFISALKEGQPDAYDRLVSHFKKQVMATAWQFSRNRDDAADIFQETFAEIVRSIHSFRGESTLGTWIYRIAVQKSLDHQRKNQRSVFVRWFSGSDDAGNAPEPVEEQTPHTDLEGKDMAIRLHKSVSKLPEKQQVAIRLFYLNQLSAQETADVMELSVPAVESLLFRARNRLKSEWKWMEEK